MATSLVRAPEAIPFREFEVVRLRAPATSIDGDLLPIGARGTIVHVHGSGEAYIVEFATPDWTVADVRPDALEPDAG